MLDTQPHPSYDVHIPKQDTDMQYVMIRAGRATPVSATVVKAALQVTDLSVVTFPYTVNAQTQNIADYNHKAESVAITFDIVR